MTQPTDNTYSPQYGDYSYASGYEPMGSNQNVRTTVNGQNVYNNGIQAPKIADLNWSKQSGYSNGYVEPSMYEGEYSTASTPTTYEKADYNVQYGVDQQQKTGAATGSGTGSTGGGMTAAGWTNAGINTVTSIANLYNAYQSNRLARKTFNFNKDMMERNYNMVLDEYNQRTRRTDGIQRQLSGESYSSANQNARSYSDRTGTKPK